MDTTSGERRGGKASTGRDGNGNGRRFGFGAKLAAGVVALGCAAALALGGMRAERPAQLQLVAVSTATLPPAGTDDLATTRCIGTVGLFACQSGQSIAGTDDFSPSGCVGVTGPFACAPALPVATAGTDDLATNWCVGTTGPFACPPTPAAQER